MLPADSSSFLRPSLPPNRPNTHSHTRDIDPGRICGPLSGVSSRVYMHNCVSPCEGKHNSISVTKSILLLILSGHTETPIKANKAQTCCQIYIIYLFTNHSCINFTGCSLIFVKIWKHVVFRGCGCLDVSQNLIHIFGNIRASVARRSRKLA